MSSQNSLFIPSTLVLLTIGFVALLGIVGTNFWLSQRAQALYGEVVEARDARSSAVELRNSVLAAESSARGFLISGNEIYLSPYDRAKVLAGRQSGVVGAKFASYGEMAKAIARLKTVIDEKFSEMDKGVAWKRERKDAEALALFQTNRGKALMDEANVFFSGLIRAADERLTESASEQSENAGWLRWVSILGGAIVVVVVGSAMLAILRYTRQLRQARDRVASLNAGLELRVEQRTADLAQARDRAELLLAEVNHRVANSLALVSSLVAMQSNAVADKGAKDALAETQARIFAISMIHKSLYTSGDVKAVAVDEYLAGLLDHLQGTLQVKGGGVTLTYQIEAVKLPVDVSVNLGVVVTEWVTNAAKYAYPDGVGEIRVGLSHLPDRRLQLSVSDSGVGRDERSPSKGTGLGTRIVKAMAASMNAQIEYALGTPGTLARLIIAAPAA